MNSTTHAIDRTDTDAAEAHGRFTRFLRSRFLATLQGRQEQAKLFHQSVGTAASYGPTADR